MKQRYILKLYIASNTINSQLAMTNLLDICREELNNQYKVEVIDILKEFEEAESDKIVAIPTLLLQPLSSPKRRLVGNLSNRKQVVQEIEMAQKGIVYN
jgi:circadian clock protein KaiB